jgi:crotonobetainyl-CoA:carnitine CoA-transferase CaiB-like acyl-CoA transferase
VRPPVTPPRLGQHSREILHDVAGLDDGQIDRLIAEKIVVNRVI